jgi:hypothetical protein
MISERSFVVCLGPLAVRQQQRRDHSQHAANINSNPKARHLNSIEISVISSFLLQLAHKPVVYEILGHCVRFLLWRKSAATPSFVG